MEEVEITFDMKITIDTCVVVKFGIEKSLHIEIKFCIKL